MLCCVGWCSLTWESEEFVKVKGGAALCGTLKSWKLEYLCAEWMSLPVRTRKKKHSENSLFLAVSYCAPLRLSAMWLSSPQHFCKPICLIWWCFVSRSQHTTIWSRKLIFSILCLFIFLLHWFFFFFGFTLQIQISSWDPQSENCPVYWGHHLPGCTKTVYPVWMGHRTVLTNDCNNTI